jgi:hypothetical protein
MFRKYWQKADDFVNRMCLGGLDKVRKINMVHESDIKATLTTISSGNAT